MFTNIYPLFERGRIMKKELSLALRDYSFGIAGLQYTNYTDGVIEGCDISVEANLINVASGIIKFNKFIYVLTEMQSVPYEPTEQFSALKIRFSTSAAVTSDFVSYSGKLVLDDNIELSENEIELCRFKLKRGSRLRNDYTCFEDIQTEFDTVNLAESTSAAFEEPGFSRFALQIFAKEAFGFGVSEAWDILFCSQCLATTPPHRTVIEAYLRSRLGVDKNEFTNAEIFEYLCFVLRAIRDGRTPNMGSGRRRRPMISME